jgi:hypothetical protein
MKIINIGSKSSHQKFINGKPIINQSNFIKLFKTNEEDKAYAQHDDNITKTHIKQNYPNIKSFLSKLSNHDFKLSETLKATTQGKKQITQAKKVKKAKKQIQESKKQIRESRKQIRESEKQIKESRRQTKKRRQRRQRR